jgi:hypothetical protein
MPQDALPLQGGPREGFGTCSRQFQKLSAAEMQHTQLQGRVWWLHDTQVTYTSNKCRSSSPRSLTVTALHCTRLVACSSTHACPSIWLLMSDLIRQAVTGTKNKHYAINTMLPKPANQCMQHCKSPAAASQTMQNSLTRMHPSEMAHPICYCALWGPLLLRLPTTALQNHMVCQA